MMKNCQKNTESRKINLKPLNTLLSSMPYIKKIKFDKYPIIVYNILSSYAENHGKNVAILFCVYHNCIIDLAKDST